MSKKANPALIGSFVLGAVALTVAGILVFGSGAFFKETARFVIFFDAEVVGLDQGAPVLFRGVPIGSVSQISAVYHTESNEFQVPVYIDVVQGSVRPVGRTEDTVPELTRLINEMGLRARLSVQSLVTGKLYVDLGLHPDKPPVYRALDSAIPEIPSIPSAFQEVQNTISALAKKLQQLPVEDLLAKISAAADSANELLSSPELKAAVSQLDDAVEEIRDLVRSANAQVGPLGDSLTRTSNQAEEALARIEETLVALRLDLGPGSPINYQLLSVLEEVSEAARAVRALAELITRQPDVIIVGRGKAEGE